MSAKFWNVASATSPSIDAKTSGGELPEPLPEAPQIPHEYLQRLGAAIRGSADLDRSAQAAIVFELRRALDVEEDDTVRIDILELLQLLRDRSDVVYPIVKEIDSIS